MNAEQVKAADERYSDAVTFCNMQAQKALIGEDEDGRETFLAIAHELRQKRFEAGRKAMIRETLTSEAEHNAHPNGRWTGEAKEGA